MTKTRCKWCNLENPNYVKYHDLEWGVANFDDTYLFEMLILESFQAGLSWECVLNKREDFRIAYDNFDLKKVILYGDKKIEELLNNQQIIRNRLKIKASIQNAKVFMQIQEEFSSFAVYLKSIVGEKTIYEVGLSSSQISDKLSKDLQKRGMTFVGTTIIYAYLQASGVINSHEEDCFLYKQIESTEGSTII